MDDISEKLKKLNFDKFIDLKQKMDDNKNLEIKLLDKKQEQNTLEKKERELSTNNINLKRSIKNLINTIEPTLISNNDLTTFDEGKLISVLKELKEEYNKISKQELLKKLKEIEEEKLEIKHIGGNLEDLKIKVNQFYKDKIILMARLVELSNKIQNIVSLYNKILSGEDKINEISKLEKNISNISTKIKKLSDNEKILNKLKSKLDGYKKDIEQLESKLTPEIIESINKNIGDLEKNIMSAREEIMFTEDFVKKIFEPDITNTQNEYYNDASIKGLSSDSETSEYHKKWNIYALGLIAKDDINYSYKTRNAANKKLEEIKSFSNTSSKYKFNLININLQNGGTVTELLDEIRKLTKNKEEIIGKINKLKENINRLIINSSDKKLSKDKYDSIDNTIQKLKEEINKLPDSFNI